MKSVILNISLRNLLRQKRRSLLLGIAIAFGAMILVLSNAFANGLSDILFNKVMKFVTGHVSVTFSEKGNMFTQVFRDGDRIMTVLKEHMPPHSAYSEAIGVFCRGIGNGKADNVILVGIDFNAQTTPEELEEAKQNFKMIGGGDFTDLKDTTIENPVLLSKEKAKYLNLKKGDLMRIRVTDINGQYQAARLNVVGIFEPANIFMSTPIFVELSRVKKILGYGPHEIAGVNITLKNPTRDAIPLADTLFNHLKPDLAVISGSVKGRGKLQIFGYRSDTTFLKRLKPLLGQLTGDTAAAFRSNGAVLSKSAATGLGISIGDTVRVSYSPKYNPSPVSVRFVVSALYSMADAALPQEALLVNESRFYDVFYMNWPAAPIAEESALLPKKGSCADSLLAPEWVLLDRCKNTDEVKKRYKEIGKLKWKAVTVDAQTMYETGSDILKLESALKLITLWAVMILFFIILIGVINTLRMTIRERTREIGTLRSIGMQKKDVRNSFILETGLLSLFASLIGTLLAFLAMHLLSLFYFDVSDNPMGILLNNGHLHFLPTAAGIVGYNLLILAIAVITAFFPARRAANLPPAAALRHYE
ncbi:MAG: hypothetical protein A2293_03335 [Elusimicrobia bacterium RIFOXYB2_FULL_49_7]|nr:MAG: hypothetical protein A2293_03335 [Elusimicrobia bacterium RIFOXYB2_FULL_49_7]